MRYDPDGNCYIATTPRWYSGWEIKDGRKHKEGVLVFCMVRACDNGSFETRTVYCRYALAPNEYLIDPRKV